MNTPSPDTNRTSFRLVLPILLLHLFTFVAVVTVAEQSGMAAQPEGVPADAKRLIGPGFEAIEAWSAGSELFVVLPTTSAETSLKLPRLANVVEQIHWQSDPKSKLSLQPEPSNWVIKPGLSPGNKPAILILRLDTEAKMFDETVLVQPDAEKVLFLPAKFARTHGENLRFEPQPHKNTVGYWSNAKDTAEWQLKITSAGEYEIDILQGCGKGHGGSDVQLQIENQTLDFIVQETGHFQNFVWRTIGKVRLSASDKTSLMLVPQKKKGGAVMDVRAVRLAPVGTARAFDPQLADPGAFENNGQ